MKKTTQKNQRLQTEILAYYETGESAFVSEHFPQLLPFLHAHRTALNWQEKKMMYTAHSAYFADLGLNPMEALSYLLPPA